MQRLRSTYQSLLVAILLALACGPLLAQTPFDTEVVDEAKQIREQVKVFTDRSLYSVDESIHFFADHRVSGLIGTNPWSSVLYVELIAPTGEALAQGKYRLSGGRTQGVLSIPTAAITGNYYLKCYTRWMRNLGPGSFSYTPLKIVNPYRSDVLASKDAESENIELRKIAYKEGMLECSTSSLSFQSGQEGVLLVKGASAVFIDQLKCCVTVVPSGSIDLSGGQIENSPPLVSDSFRVSFLPDLGDGVSISGTVVGAQQSPAPYTTLHFSLLGADPDYFACMSDAYGRFILSMPAGSGDQLEFFVTPEQEDGSSLEVRIDQEFDSRAHALPAEPFKLTMDEEELARKIALNSQLTKVFKSGVLSLDSTVIEEYSEGDRIPFYGTRVRRLLIDDYVRLPNLEEIFINLIPEVQFYRKQGKNKIRILSDNSSIDIYNPLIMIDHISVFDHEALLALSPEKIERIDLIDDVYLKGNVTFGGVLAIHSRKGDMAGIDLPASSYFFDYQPFNPEPFPVRPPVQESRIPETRNTYLWDGGLILEQGKQLEIPFQAPGSSGTYKVLVRGVSPDGEVYSATAEFRVE